MVSLLIKLVPTLWPFLKELFGGNGRPRGGKQKSPVFKYIAIFLIIIAIAGAVSYDVIKTLYTANQGYMLEHASLKQGARMDSERIKALEAENAEIKKANVALGRDLSAANAKLDFLQPEDQRQKTARQVEHK